MPNSRQHREKASRNRVFLDSIPVDQFPDWAAVVAFYEAVHLVERLRTLVTDPNQQHSTDHQDRLQFVQRDHRTIHRDFHEKFNASLIARYQTVNSFNAQFTVADVRDVLIGQYLAAIEQYVTSQFAPPPPAAPSTGS